jgi:hypothetical protein
MSSTSKGSSGSGPTPRRPSTFWRSTNEQASIKLDERWFAESFKTGPVWGIADGWFSEVGAYCTAAGALKANPDPKTYLTDEYMKRVAGLDK